MSPWNLIKENNIGDYLGLFLDYSIVFYNRSIELWIKRSKFSKIYHFIIIWSYLILTQSPDIVLIQNSLIRQYRLLELILPKQILYSSIVPSCLRLNIRYKRSNILSPRLKYKVLSCILILILHCVLLCSSVYGHFNIVLEEKISEQRKWRKEEKEDERNEGRARVRLWTYLSELESIMGKNMTGVNYK